MISVLYVDDDDSFSRVFKLFLEKMGGFTVTTERSGARAAGMIEPGSFDIVVSDYQMPGMTGLDLLRSYKSREINIPFILFTGKGREEVVIEAINEGATFYLQKGGDPQSLYAELAHKIRQAVQADAAQRALLESEEKFRRLFETAFDGIIILSDFTIVDCNKQITALFHADRDQIIGNDFTRLAPEIQPEGCRTRNKTEMLFEAVLREEGTFTTWKFKRLDGTEFDAEMSINRFETQGRLYYQAIIRDITERILAADELEQRNIDLSAAYEELTASGEELKFRLEELRESQEQLQESRKRYKDLADLLPEGVYECTSDGQITYVNHQVYRLFGYEPNQPIDRKNVLDFVIPGERERVVEAFKSITYDAPTRPHEYQAVRSDGSTFPVIVHSTQMVENNEVVGFRGVIVDISYIKKAEEDIRESRQKLADVIDFLPDATVVINKEGEVIFWNRAIVEMTGVPAGEMLGKGNYEYSIPFYGERRPILIDLALHPEDFVKEQYLNVRWEGDKVIGEAYMTGPTLNQSYLWGVASPLWDENGDIVGAIECIRDITTRKKAEESLWKSREELEILVGERTGELTQANKALRESEERYRTLVEFSPDAIFVHDGKQILFANPAAVRLLGAGKPDELVGVDLYTFVHPDYHHFVSSRIESSLTGSELGLPIEEWFVSKTGENLQVEVSTMTIRYQGKPAILVIVRDIRARKRAEAQLMEYARVLEEKNHELDFLANQLIAMNQELDNRVRERTGEVNRLLKQKDDFIIRLGHDLKTPLTPLIALLPTLFHEEKDIEKRELYRVLLRSVYTIREQTEKILTLARLSEQDGVAEFEMIHPASLIHQAAEKQSLFIEQKNLSVEVLVPDDLTVRFSNRDASSVFENLLGNAVKYTQNGGLIRVLAESDENAVTIIFEDTGIGLSVEEKAHVFDDFYRADQSRHDRQSSGLGLAIVKRVMDYYGGRVWVESDGHGTGSRFMICLPVTRDGCKQPS